ncbi:hypothetical protein HS088_TW13G01167 [Tripterygium wilfordii]|uniref:DUF641 domain-containing protein n=1 Tax=Tripterygium wilfordii TaxID=458696 RepID=A0A7J7CW15_TRIWF|nr:protein GRAVITROPIC IN THE LIGHT 1-like [Tripterygium wilfordii]KAF5738271.1 hypothetical protein HS088_TW13G01167 [Tripterygium wilfordii]
METFKCRSVPNGKSKLARTFQKVIKIRTATKVASNNNGVGHGIGICMLTSQHRFEGGDSPTFCRSNSSSTEKQGEVKARQRAVMEALVAKLFASVTSIKAAYAELQMAQSPYNSEAIQAADQAVVDELKAISELKRSFLKKILDFSPQVTMMLAEIQEQQSLMKTYEITIKKLESQVEIKEYDISSLKKKLDDSIGYNKSLENKLNASGSLSMIDYIQVSRLNITNFVQVLQYTLRSMRSFVKLMIREMELAHWDLDSAARGIEPDAVFTNPSHRCFVFESFVCRTMFEGFNQPHFMLTSETQKQDKPPTDYYINRFKNLKSLTPKQFLTQNPNSSFAKFTRIKYLSVVHAKMECSLFGNLNQRKLLNSGSVPDSGFFTGFAEMAKRVWVLHSLAFSFGEDVNVYQVKKNCRFSEVYMDAVSDESVMVSPSQSSILGKENLRVGFTVVPGLKIGKNVIQSQVYLPTATSPSPARL